jgi:hypothetical protein
MHPSWQRKLQRLIFGEFLSAENAMSGTVGDRPKTSNRRTFGTIRDIATKFQPGVMCIKTYHLIDFLLIATTAYFGRIFLWGFATF